MCCHPAWGPGILHVAHEASESGVLRSSAGPAEPQAVSVGSPHVAAIPFSSTGCRYHLIVLNSVLSLALVFGRG